MKVLAIGGSGGMGRATVRAALTYDFVSEIVVAGIDKELAEHFVDSLNDDRVRSIYLDVTEDNCLRQAIRDVDVVLNSAGPFFRFGVPVLTAAIDEGKHYSDICDDWQPTVEMLKLSSRAQQNNVTAVIGLGASPGIANLLCVKAATALDEVDTIVSAWRLSGAVNANDGFNRPAKSGQVDAAAVHLVHCLSEKIRVLQDGEIIDTTPLEHSQIAFPNFGALDVWSLGHPEAITLRRRFPALKNSYNGMLGIHDIVDSLQQIAGAVAAGQMSVDEAALMLTNKGDKKDSNEGSVNNELVNKELANRQVQQSHDTEVNITEGFHEETPALLAYAKGRKDGQNMTSGAFIRHYPTGGMATITGIPHALFLPLLHHGHLKENGVFAPEEVIDPDVFFEWFDSFCGAKGAGLTVLTSS